jgi:hypothetical protein
MDLGNAVRDCADPIPPVDSKIKKCIFAKKLQNKIDSFLKNDKLHSLQLLLDKELKNKANEKNLRAIKSD